MVVGGGIWIPPWLGTLFKGKAQLVVEVRCFRKIWTILRIRSTLSSISIMQCMLSMVGIVVVEMFSILIWFCRFARSSWIWIMFSCRILVTIISMLVTLLEGKELLRVWSISSELVSTLAVKDLYNPRSTMIVLS